MDHGLGWLLDAVRSLDPVVRILVAGIAMFCETSILLGLVVPGDTIVLVAATGTHNAAQYVALLLAVIVGSLGGESVGFALGRFFGPRIRHSRLGRRIGERNWERAEHYLDRRGGIAVFISRFLPVLHSLVPVTVGTSEMTYRRFLAWTAPACTIWAAAYCTVGWVAASGYRHLAERLHWAGWLFAGVLILFVLVVWIVRRALGRSEERHMGDDAD